MTPHIIVSYEFFDFLVSKIEPFNRLDSKEYSNVYIGGLQILCRNNSSSLEEALADCFLIVMNNYNRYIVRLAKDFLIIYGRSQMVEALVR